MRKFSDWLSKRLNEGFSIESYMDNPLGVGGEPVVVRCKSGLSFTVEEGGEPEGRDREDFSQNFIVSNLSKPVPEAGWDDVNREYEFVQSYEIDDVVDQNGGIVEEEEE